MKFIYPKEDVIEDVIVDGVVRQRKLIRTGIDDNFRGEVWVLLCSEEERQENRRLLEESFARHGKRLLNTYHY